MISGSTMDEYLDKCVPVMANIINVTTGNSHWVLVKKKVGSDYDILDPSRSNSHITKLSQHKNDGAVYNIRVFESTNGGLCK